MNGLLGTLSDSLGVLGGSMDFSGPLGKSKTPGYSRTVMNVTSTHSNRHPATGAVSVRTSPFLLLSLRLLP